MASRQIKDTAEGEQEVVRSGSSDQVTEGMETRRQLQLLGMFTHAHAHAQAHTHTHTHTYSRFLGPVGSFLSLIHHMTLPLNVCADV